MLIFSRKNSCSLFLLLNLSIVKMFATADEQINSLTPDFLQPQEILAQQYQALKASPQADPLLLKATQDLLHDIEQKTAKKQPTTIQPTAEEPAAQQETKEPLTTSDELMQFAALEKEIDFFNHNLFIENLLDPKDHVALEAVKLFLSSKVAAIKSAITNISTDKTIDQTAQIEALLLFCFAQKSVAAKLELLSIDSTIIIDSPLKQMLPLAQIYHIHIAILSELCRNLSSYWPLLCNNLISIETLQKELFSNTILTNLIVKNFPANLHLTSLFNFAPSLGDILWLPFKIPKIPAAVQQFTHLYRLLAHLYQLLACDIYNTMPTLCEKYQDIIKHYNNSSIQITEKFLQEVASTALDLEFKRQELESNNAKEFLAVETQEIINLFTLKLLTIQQELLASKTWEENYTQYPAKAPIWVKYQEIMLDQQLGTLCQEDQLFNTYLTNYNKIMSCFFATQKQSPNFLYTLLLTTAQFKSILSHNEQSFIKSLFKHPDASTCVLKKMAQTLTNIALYLQQTTDKSDGIVHAILTEQCKGDSQNQKKGDQDGSLWDGAQQLVTDNVQPIKKAVFYLFTHVSPYIGTILVSWLFPKFSQEIKTKFSQFFAQQATTPDDKKAQHFGDFMTSNPDVLDELCKLNPDLIQSLTKQPSYEINTQQ